MIQNYARARPRPAAGLGYDFAFSRGGSTVLRMDSGPFVALVQRADTAVVVREIVGAVAPSSPATASPSPGSRRVARHPDLAAVDGLSRPQGPDRDLGVFKEPPSRPLLSTAAARPPSGFGLTGDARFACSTPRRISPAGLQPGRRHTDKPARRDAGHVSCNGCCLVAPAGALVACIPEMESGYVGGPSRSTSSIQRRPETRDSASGHPRRPLSPTAAAPGCSSSPATCRSCSSSSRTAGGSSRGLSLRVPPRPTSGSTPGSTAGPARGRFASLALRRLPIGSGKTRTGRVEAIDMAAPGSRSGDRHRAGAARLSAAVSVLLGCLLSVTPGAARARPAVTVAEFNDTTRVRGRADQVATPSSGRCRRADEIDLIPYSRIKSLAASRRVRDLAKPRRWARWCGAPRATRR
jgi:hypothetical protein